MGGHKHTYISTCYPNPNIQTKKGMYSCTDNKNLKKKQAKRILK